MDIITHTLVTVRKSLILKLVAIADDCTETDWRDHLNDDERAYLRQVER